MNYEDFRKETLKVFSSHKFKFTNSIGNRFIYRWLRKNNVIDSSISEAMFGKIIKSVHNYLIEELMEYKSIKFPYRMGELEIIKLKPKFKVINNKLSNNYCVDWEATLKLWHSDTISKNKKIIVKFDKPKIFRIKYNKRNSDYENKIYIKFIPLRRLKSLLRDKIDNSNFDTYLEK